MLFLNRHSLFIINFFIFNLASCFWFNNQSVTNIRIDVEELYAKDHKLNREDVNAILEWVRAQPHLPEITEMQAILFLHSCFYETEAARKTIDNYFTYRTRYPECFQPAPEDVIRRHFTVHFYKVLPRTPENDMIVSMKLLQTSPKVFNCLDHIKVTVMVLTLYIHQFGPANGLILLMDMEGVTFAHLFRLNLMAVKRSMGFLQEAAPVRIKHIHYVNVGTITGKVLALLKPFMRKEVAEAITLHSTSMESLYEYIPKKCLPEDYGGELAPITTLNEGSDQQLLDNLEFFKWHETQKVDESKRIVDKL